MKKEIDALQANDAQELPDLPNGKKAISNKWIYRIKLKCDGSLERYKSRLVIQGNHQKKGIDFF